MRNSFPHNQYGGGRNNKVSPSRMSVRSSPSNRFPHKTRSRAASIVSTSSITNNKRKASKRPSAVASATSLGGPESRKARRDIHKKSKCSVVISFWQNFTAILFSPLFLRHRNVFYFFMEVLAPALVALIIFAAFTSGISWKQAQLNKKEAYGRILKFPDVSMEDTTANFRSVHADTKNQVLIFYSPVNEFTSTIMQYTLEIIGIRDSNIVFKHGESTTGVVGVRNEAELFERALYHRNERISHGEPVGVIFNYDPKDVSSLTGVPYNVTFSISNYDLTISQTEDARPFVPPATTTNWKSPYLTSGFLGLQYAIEESLIRLIIEKQKAVEMKEISANAAAAARSLTVGEDGPLTSDDIDVDLLSFLISETLDEINAEKERREEMDELGESYDSHAAHAPVGRGIGRSLWADDSRSTKNLVRPISTSAELPRRLVRAFNSDHTGTLEFRELLSYVVAFSLSVAYSFMSFFIVRQIAEENLSGIKELLQIHGLPQTVHWTLLFLHAFVFRAITSALILMSLRIDYGNGKVAQVVNLDVLYVLIFIHQLSLTCMNYFIASYIKSIRWCGIVAVSSCVFSFYLPESFSGMKLIGVVTDFVVSLIFPNWCFRHALHCLLDHESNEKAIGWHNIMEQEYVTNTITVGEGMIRLTLMGAVYFALAAYIGVTGSTRLFPTSHKWHTFRDWIKKKRETRSHSKESHKHDIDEFLENDFPKPPIYEDPHPDKDCLVRVRNISKSYGKYKVALDSLSIDVQHQEITVFLGHSGCGKSTLISILAGILQPSNGHATVNGFDVSTHARKARQFMGVCPQKLVAFNLLTVREHVHLCYRLRGYSGKDCNHLSASILTQLQLWNVRSSLPSNLTRDELRRLGIGMSMVDSPKVLLLDEPTRGMDASGRREIWDIILSMRHHHTIIVMTNYMDEAEQLADRLVLLAHGRLVCCGSLEYLKNQYDTGYFLKLIPFSKQFIDANAVINFVRSILGSKVQIKRHKRLKDVDTLELELPTREKDHFADFCDELDKKKDDLHIMKYSIRQVNLNDIFIKICSSIAADGYSVDLYVRRDSAGDIKTVLTSEIPEIPEGTTKNTSRVHHFNALLRRSWTVTKTAKRTVILHFIIPLIVVWIVVFQAKLFVQSKGENPDMPLHPARFGRSLRIFSQIIDDDPSINYSSHISRVLQPYDEEVDKQDRVITKLYEALNTEPGNIGYAKERHMLAFEFGKSGRDFQFMGYFATGSLHSAPIALNLMNNVLLSAISEPERNFTKNWRRYEVHARNNPPPQPVEGQFERGCGITCVLLALLMSFALAFISHSCCIQQMTERNTGMKHLILMSGVDPTNYWLCNFVMDAFVMFIMSVIIVVIFLSDLYQTFYSTEVICAIWLICSIYLIWGGLLFCYYLSSIIPSKFNGYNFLAVLHVFLGIIPFLLMTISRPDAGVPVFCRNALLVLLPPYTITSAMYHFFSNAGQRNICRNINSFISWACSPDRNRERNTFYTEHAINDVEFRKMLNSQDPKLTRCCDLVCKTSTDVSDKCFEPPKVFNASAETWKDPGLITDVCALLFQGFIFWLLLMLTERKLFSRLLQHIVLKLLHPRDKRESGSSNREQTHEARKFRQVKRESLAVDSVVKDETKEWPDDVALVCQNLTKSSTSTMIIKDFNLEVKKGQCIAILGRGSSGKSCIARMIAGDLIPTQGNCFLKNANLLRNRKEYLSRIGYCPQRSCIFDEFTGAQMMELMGRLRGIPSGILSTQVNKWLSVMGLSEVASDKCKEYGDGIKQRLCTAMALIGEPEIILLDEVTTGVDPTARERIWCVIEHLSQAGFTIIFTTYCTDEAFSLADKVVVIAEGGIQCIGEPQEVQKAYARGHTITFKLRSDIMSSAEMMSLTEVRVTEFKDHVNEIYKHIDLLDEHDEMIMFFLRDARLSWAEVFRRGHYLTSVHSDIVASYEVTEGGVDDIFVFLTNKYYELSKPRLSDTPEYMPRKSREIDGIAELKKAGETLKRSSF